MLYHQNILAQVNSGCRAARVSAGNGRCACARNHDADIFVLLAHDLQRIRQPGRRDDRRPMLVVMEYGNIEHPFQCFFNIETLGCFDIFEVDAAKGRGNGRHYFYDLIRVVRIQLDVEHVDICEFLEQYALSLHHGFTGKCAAIAEPQNC
jgi:hypothetical protein